MGPQVKRSNVNTAPLPGMQQPTNDFLMTLLSQGQGRNALSNMQNLTGVMPIQPSALQSLLGQTFQQLVSPGRMTASEQAFNVALPGIQQQLTGVPGMDVVNAALPVYNTNLTDALARQRQFGGPRFASESGRQARELEQRSMNDFNLFQQQVMEAGRNRQLQAAEVLGSLGGGADTSRQGIMGQAGNFALGEQQLNVQSQAQQMQLLQYLLGAAFTGGGYNASPVITQSPSTFGNIMSGIGGLGGLATGLGWNPLGRGNG
jgi:hypothetical protein